MRRGIAGLGILAIAASLAACGGKSGTTTDNQSAGGAGASGTITIWADDTRYSQVEEFAKDFTASSGVSVSVVQKSESDMDTEFTTQVPTGNGPDLIVMAHDKLGSLVSNGVVAPVDLGDKSKFSDVAVKAVTYNGQTYGVPYAVESVALVRNNKLTTDTPATFADTLTSGQAAGVQYPFVIQMGEHGDPYHFYGFQTSFGAPVFMQEADGSYTDQLGLKGPEGAAFAEWLKAQGGAGILDLSVSADIAKQTFLDGKAPYIVTGPWNTDAFRKAGMDISVLPIPSAGGKEAQPFVGVQAFFPSAKTENGLLVSKFMQYMGTKDVQQKMFDLGGRVPAMTSVAEGISDPDIKGFAEVSGKGVPMPAIPAMAAVWEFWGATEGNIVAGKEAPADGWTAMVSNIENTIKK